MGERDQVGDCIIRKTRPSTLTDTSTIYAATLISDGSDSFNLHNRVTSFEGDIPFDQMVSGDDQVVLFGESHIDQAHRALLASATSWFQGQGFGSMGLEAMYGNEESLEALAMRGVDWVIYLPEKETIRIP